MNEWTRNDEVNGAFELDGMARYLDGCVPAFPKNCSQEIEHCPVLFGTLVERHEHSGAMGKSFVCPP